MTPGLAHYKAVLWGVWGAAVHCYDRWRNLSNRGEDGTRMARKRRGEGENEVKEREGKRTDKQILIRRKKHKRKEKRMRGIFKAPVD